MCAARPVRPIRLLKGILSPGFLPGCCRGCTAGGGNFWRNRGGERQGCEVSDGEDFMVPLFPLSSLVLCVLSGFPLLVCFLCFQPINVFPVFPNVSYVVCVLIPCFICFLGLPMSCMSGTSSLCLHVPGVSFERRTENPSSLSPAV